MPKRLTLIRHAKSSWNNANLSDFDRPLNQRGQNDAPKMGQIIQRELPKIDYVLCSTSQRTRETLLLLNKALNLDQSKIGLQDALYHPSTKVIKNFIFRLPKNLDHVALISHNPATTELANQLQNEHHFDNVPTCGVVHIQFDIVSWEEILSAKGQLIHVVFPKEVL